MKLKGVLTPADAAVLGSIFSGVNVDFELDTEGKTLTYRKGGSAMVLVQTLTDGEMPREEPEKSVPPIDPNPNPAPEGV